MRLLLLVYCLLPPHRLAEYLRILGRYKGIPVSTFLLLTVAGSAHHLRLEPTDVPLYCGVPSKQIVKYSCRVYLPSFIAIKVFECGAHVQVFEELIIQLACGFDKPPILLLVPPLLLLGVALVVLLAGDPGLYQGSNKIANGLFPFDYASLDGLVLDDRGR